MMSILTMAQQHKVERYLIRKDRLSELLNHQSLNTELTAHTSITESPPIWHDQFIVQIDPNQDERELQYFDLKDDGTPKNVPFLEMAQCECHFFLTIALFRSIGVPVL